MNPGPSPLVQRRRLSLKLRRARAGRYTQEQVAQSMDWSLSKVIRIESGAVTIQTNDLRALLGKYEISDSDQVDEMLELAKASRRSSSWSRYRADISAQYLQYIEYEEAASVLRLYEPLLLPGLLQTAEYATAVIRQLASPGTSEDLIRTRIEIRLSRQELLDKDPPPAIISVLDEAAVQRLTGEGDIARGQIARLLELASRPNITLEIVPFSAGFHRGMLEPFLIVEFPDPEDGNILFIESSRDSIISHDEPGEIMSGYLEVFSELRSISLGETGSIAYLRNLESRITK